MKLTHTGDGDDQEKQEMILTGNQFLQEDNDATLFQSTAMQEVQLRKFTSNPVEKK